MYVFLLIETPFPLYPQYKYKTLIKFVLQNQVYVVNLLEIINDWSVVQP